jgi:hypothetical protein
VAFDIKNAYLSGLIIKSGNVRFKEFKVISIFVRFGGLSSCLIDFVK